MSQPTIAELQVRLSVQGLQYATSLREALKRVGGAEIRRQLDGQARAILGIEKAMQSASKAGTGFSSFLKGAARMTIVAQGLYRGFRMVGGAIEDALQPLMEFQHNMGRVQVKGSLTAEQTKVASQVVKDLTGQTRFSPTEASASAVGLAAAGQAANLKTALPTTLRFAQANDVTPEKSTEILLGVMGQFKKDASQLESIGDMITKADAMSVLNVSEIYDTLKYVGPLAKQAKMPLQEVLAMVVSLGDAGIKASKGGTGLRNLMTSLARPPRRGKQAAKMLGMIGLTQKDFQAALMADGGVPAFLNRVHGEFEKRKITAPLQLQFYATVMGQYGMTSAAALVSDSAKGKNGHTEIQDARDELDRASGTMKRAADIMGETLEGRIARVTAKFELLKINMGERFIPVIEKVLAEFDKFVSGALSNPKFMTDLEALGTTLKDILPPAVEVALAALSSLAPVIRWMAGASALPMQGKNFKLEQSAPGVAAAGQVAADKASYYKKSPTEVLSAAIAAQTAYDMLDKKQHESRAKKAAADEARGGSPTVAGILAARGAAPPPAQIDLNIMMGQDGELKAMIQNISKNKGAADLRVGVTSSL